MTGRKDDARRVEAEEFRRCSKELETENHRLQCIIEGSGDAIWDWPDLSSDKLWWSSRFFEMLGYDPDVFEPTLKTFYEMMHPDDRAARAPAAEDYINLRDPFEAEYRLRTRSGAYIWCHARGRVFRDDEGRPVRMSGMVRDISERKRAEDALKRMEWLLTPRDVNQTFGAAMPAQPYGDLSDLNRTGLILNAVGRDVLREIVQDFLQLLGTSVAVYEKSGEYALGLFTSGWCRFLDQAGRSLCRTGDNAEALASGCWLCHESCWTDASKPAIECNEPVDVECRGGIRLYAVPIRAGDEVIGSINFGYGDPPTDRAELARIAQQYAVDAADLRQWAQEYESRPPFIIESAKSRLRSTARLIGEIVERSRAQSRLREEMERAQSYLDVAGVILVGLDLEGKVAMINRAGCETLGCREEEILGEPWFERFVPEAMRSDVFVVFTEMTTGRRELAEYFENPIVQRNGEERVVAWHNALVYDRSGKIIGTLSSGEDVTERRQAEESLRKREAHLQSIVDLSPIGIGLGKGEYCEMICSPALQRIFGYSAEEFAAIPFTDMMPPEDVEREVPLYEELVAGQREAYHIEKRCIRKDGMVRWLSVNVAAVRDEQGQLDSTLAMVEDITDRKRDDEERRKLESQVQHAQKLESLGVLAGGIAHDFNNLLVAILGHADLALADMSPAAPQRRSVEEIHKAARRASELTNQMLAYSGRGRFVIRSINLNEIVQEMGYLLQASISKKVVLRYELADGLPPVEVDISQIRQVVMNLVINASEAIGQRSGVITIATGIMDAQKEYLAESYLNDDLPGGWYVYLEVSDTGCGMSAETRAKLFDPFFTTKLSGRGLGLAAVLGIVRGHSGAIKVYSEPGRGSSFRILLPAGEGVVESLDETLPSADAHWRGSGTILVVDDEEAVRMLARLMLERHGFEVLTAADGREAVDIYSQRSDEITAVLLDMTMPHMSGEEAYRQMRRIRPDVRVVLASGYNEQDATCRFTGKGLAGFLQKPFDMRKLIDMFRGVVG